MELHESKGRSRSIVRLITALLAPLGLCAWMASACRARIPGPEIEPSLRLDDGLCVPFPPPPAKTDEMTRRPSPDAVWMDGEWTWGTRRYAWHPGDWKVPPAGASYARPSLIRLSNGALAYFPGHWHPTGDGVDADVNASLQCPPPPLPPVPDVADVYEADIEFAETPPYVTASGAALDGALTDARIDGVTHDATLPSDAASDGITDGKADGWAMGVWDGDAPLPLIQPPK